MSNMQDEINKKTTHVLTLLTDKQTEQTEINKVIADILRDVKAYMLETDKRLSTLEGS